MIVHFDKNFLCSILITYSLWSPMQHLYQDPNYHIPFTVLVCSYVAEWLLSPLRYQGPGYTT